MKHIEDILNTLELYRGDLHRGGWSGVFNERLANTIDPAFNLYAVFCFENKPLLMFFDNPSKTIEGNLHKWIWNLNEGAVAVVVTDQTVDVFNAFDMDGEQRLLRRIGGSDMLPHFNYLKIVTGETWSEWRDKFVASNRVDSRLLKDLESVRQITVQKLQALGVKELAYRIANAWIGRLLFLRYLIDRKVKIHFGEFADQRISSDDLNHILESPQTTFALFEHLKRQFNGDLFPFIEIPEGDDKPSVKEQDVMDAVMLQNFIKLFKGDDLNGQLSLFPLYDFSVIPIEFVSNVYEHFIGTDEAEKKNKREKDQQRKQGAYYTPKFLADYVLEKTVGKHLYDKPTTSSCRVLDPACGSGIFLVEALRRLIVRYQSLNTDYLQHTEQYKNDLCRLVWDNIFGIDIDTNAVDVAIFSLYITLLDYQNPADIEHFKLPRLRDSNFFVADTFKTEHQFNSILKQKMAEMPFDFIIGNPPWGKTSGKQIYSDYCKKREKAEKKVIGASNKEAAQAFLIRASDFSSAGHTRVALVVTSKVLYNLQAAGFRSYFLRHFFLDEVLELSPVRHQVFDKTITNGTKSKAVAPASVLFYRWADGADTNHNPVRHNTLKPNIFFRLFKRLVFEKYDRKIVSQERFLEYDWLFKLLVYGNVLDFHFLKRLLKYPNIKQVLESKGDLFLEPKQGVKRADKYKSKKEDTSEFMDWDFLDTGTGKEELQPFFIKPDHSEWKLPEVSHLPSRDIFLPPALLITGGIKKNLRSNSAVNYQKLIFTSSVRAIKAKNENGIPLLRTFAGLLNSSLFAYYILMKGSSAAVEREEAHDEETFGLPFIESSTLPQLVEEMENIKQQVFEKSNLPNPELLALQRRELQLTESIDAEIIKGFNLSEEERALLHYAENVSISIFNKEELSPAYRKTSFQDPMLIDYAQVFLHYFKPRFTDHLGVEVFQSDYCIAVRIFRAEQHVGTPITFRTNESFQDIAKLFFSQSVEQLTADLFVQKDVRGFERKAFYIIKPNERKCWHKAVAYLDAYEFGEALERL